ncbi:VWA domain-containing protein [Candidatus Margulisiibacteriota bacterium]
MFRFADPSYFNYLWLLPLLGAAYYFFFKWRKSSLQKFGNTDLLLMPSLSKWLRITRITLIFLVLLLIIFTLARPQFGTKKVKVDRVGMNILFAVDTSKSMLAEDVYPNRLKRAKSEIKQFIRKLQGDNAGLIAFAGSAYLQVPLTFDYAAMELFLDDLDTTIIPDPGTAISEAFLVARQAFGTQEKKYKVLILLTDGEDTVGSALDAAGAAAAEGIKIYVVGLGDPQGRPIPLRNAGGALIGYKKDKNGGVVLSRLNEPMLQEIARASKGKYLRVTNTGAGLDALYNDLMRQERKELKEQMMQQYGEGFQWILLLGIILLVGEMFLGERMWKRSNRAE